MQSTQELLSAYELANRIIEQASIYREAGESALLAKAWEYSNAENARRNAEQNLAVMISAGADCPGQLAESLEREKAKAFAACDAFAEEYDSYRERHLTSSAS
jgi:hypothetical protein